MKMVNILCVTGLILSGLIGGLSFPTEAEETYVGIDGTASWSSTFKALLNGVVSFSIDVKYRDANNADLNLPGAKIKTNSLTTLGTEFSLSDQGKIAFDVKVKDIQDPFTMDVLMQFRKPFVNDCVKVVNVDDELYSFSVEKEINANYDYSCSIILKDDSQNDAPSNVGAAAIYSIVNQALTLCPRRGQWDCMDLLVKWPVDEDSGFSPSSNQNPSVLEVNSELYSDGSSSTDWEYADDIVRALFAEALLFDYGYEGNPDLWPSGSIQSHGWYLPTITSLDGYERQWAFITGFSYFFALYSDVHQNKDDVLYNEEEPDGFHVERTDAKLNGRIFYDGESSPSCDGEIIEGCIAGVFWDLVDDDGIDDETDDSDDDMSKTDEYSLGFMTSVWAIIDDNNVKNILDFWDYLIMRCDGDYGVKKQQACEEIFLKNNVGRYNYGSNGEKVDPNTGLRFLNLQVMGMNTDNRPTEQQMILVRCIVQNGGNDDFQFNQNGQFCIAEEEPNKAIWDKIGRSVGYNVLEHGASVLVIGTHYLNHMNVDKNKGTYRYWPYYIDNNRNSPANNWWEVSFDSYSTRIWKTSIDQWVALNSPNGGAWDPKDLNGGNSYWGIIKEYELDVNGEREYSGMPVYLWCAAGSAGLDIDSANPPLWRYSNCMDAVISQEEDWRLLGLHIHFSVKNEVFDDADYFSVDYFTGNNWVSIFKADYDIKDWKSYTFDIPPSAFRPALDGDPMQIRFLFHSDDSCIKSGTFLDDMKLEAYHQ